MRSQGGGAFEGHIRGGTSNLDVELTRLPIEAHLDLESVGATTGQRLRLAGGPEAVGDIDVSFANESASADVVLYGLSANTVLMIDASPGDGSFEASFESSGTNVGPASGSLVLQSTDGYVVDAALTLIPPDFTLEFSPQVPSGAFYAPVGALTGEIKAGKRGSQFLRPIGAVDTFAGINLDGPNAWLKVRDLVSLSFNSPAEKGGSISVAQSRESDSAFPVKVVFPATSAGRGTLDIHLARLPLWVNVNVDLSAPSTELIYRAASGIPGASFSWRPEGSSAYLDGAITRVPREMHFAFADLDGNLTTAGSSAFVHTIGATAGGKLSVNVRDVNDLFLKGEIRGLPSTLDVTFDPEARDRIDACAFQVSASTRLESVVLHVGRSSMSEVGFLRGGTQWVGIKSDPNHPPMMDVNLREIGTVELCFNGPDDDVSAKIDAPATESLRILYQRSPTEFLRATLNDVVAGTYAFGTEGVSFDYVAPGEIGELIIEADGVVPLPKLFDRAWETMEFRAMPVPAALSLDSTKDGETHRITLGPRGAAFDTLSLEATLETLPPAAPGGSPSSAIQPQPIQFRSFVRAEAFHVSIYESEKTPFSLDNAAQQLIFVEGDGEGRGLQMTADLEGVGEIDIKIERRPPPAGSGEKGKNFLTIGAFETRSEPGWFRVHVDTGTPINFNTHPVPNVLSGGFQIPDPQDVSGDLMATAASFTLESSIELETVVVSSRDEGQRGFHGEILGVPPGGLVTLKALGGVVFDFYLTLEGAPATNPDIEGVHVSYYYGPDSAFRFSSGRIRRLHAQGDLDGAQQYEGAPVFTSYTAYATSFELVNNVQDIGVYLVHNAAEDLAWQVVERVSDALGPARWQMKVAELVAGIPIPELRFDRYAAAYVAPTCLWSEVGC